MTNQNPVNELLEVQKNNQKILEKIAQGQSELIALGKTNRNNGRWKIGLEFLKLFIWPAIFLLSFYFSIQALKGFTQTLVQRTSPSNIIEQIKPSANSNAQNISNLIGDFLGN